MEKTDEPDIRANGSRFDSGKTGSRDGGDRTQTAERTLNRTTGWRPTCECGTSERGPLGNRHVPLAPVPCRVLDPFLGSGTTAAVALELGRHATGIELNPKYVALARRRCDVTPGLQLA